MNRERLKKYLTSRSFKRDRDSEYNRDLFTNEEFVVEGRRTKIDVFVDRHTVRFVWWYEPDKKVGKSFYMNKIDSISDDFVKNVVEDLRNLCRIA